MKIAELIESFDAIAKTRKYNTKTAFIANPNVPPPQPGQPVQAALPQGQVDPSQAQQQAAPQAQPQPQPAAPQQNAPQAQQDPLMDQIMGMVQQLPPNVQQQVVPLVQQLSQLPPDQKQQQLTALAQQLAGMQQQQPQQQQPQQQQPQGGMVAQAADEDLYAAAQGGQMDPSMMSGDLSQQQQATSGAEDSAQAEASAIEAKNELDNVKVTLTVRELLDLVGKGTATASLLKVKQLADTHKQKMDQSKQKADQQQAQQQADQQADQQGMMSGGIYPTPMAGGGQ